MFKTSIFALETSLLGKYLFKKVKFPRGNYQPTHIDEGGSGTGVLGHPPARKTRRWVLKTPVPGHPLFYVCIIHSICLRIILLLKKCGDDIESNGCC